MRCNAQSDAKGDDPSLKREVSVLRDKCLNKGNTLPDTKIAHHKLYYFDFPVNDVDLMIYNLYYIVPIMLIMI